MIHTTADEDGLIENNENTILYTESWNLSTKADLGPARVPR